jgi:hypothetical protein
MSPGATSWLSFQKDNDETIQKARRWHGQNLFEDSIPLMIFCLSSAGKLRKLKIMPFIRPGAPIPLFAFPENQRLFAA